MLASTRSKAPARTPRAPSPRTSGRRRRSAPRARAAGAPPRRSRCRPRPSPPSSRAAMARMPLPVPTSRMRPGGRSRTAPRGRPGRGACSRGCPCRRPGRGPRSGARPSPGSPRTSHAGTMRKRAGVEGAEALAEARHPVDVGHRGVLDARDGKGSSATRMRLRGRPPGGSRRAATASPPGDVHLRGPAVPASQSSAVATSSSAAGTVTRKALTSSRGTLGRMSFIRSRIDRPCPRLGDRQRLPELLDELPLLGGERVGVTTRTATCRSPRPRAPRWGTPWLRMRKLAPVCVPSGIESPRGLRRAWARPGWRRARPGRRDRHLAEEGRPRRA